MSQSTFAAARVNGPSRPRCVSAVDYACDWCGGSQIIPSWEGDLIACPECAPSGPVPADVAAEVGDAEPCNPRAWTFLRDQGTAVRRLARMLTRRGESADAVRDVVEEAVLAAPDRLVTFADVFPRELEAHVRAVVAAWRQGVARA